MMAVARVKTDDDEPEKRATLALTATRIEK
jgi:hypothetical protein